MHVEQFDARAYWEERLARSSGLEGVGYLGLGQPFNAWMYRVRSHVFKGAVKRYFRDRSAIKVLDVGSGTGEYLRNWHELGVGSMIGSDLTEAAVGHLREVFKRDVILRLDISSPTADLPKEMDAVSCMDVLFHVVDDVACAQAITGLARVLKPGGYLFLSENFVHVAAGNQRHFKQRTLDSYLSMLADSGMEVVERRPMFHLMNGPVDSRSRTLGLWWHGVMALCRRSHRLGGLLGALLFPLELLLVRTRAEGASTELMVCRRIR